MTLSAAIETITPAIAADLLNRNTHNRRLSESFVDLYCEDIANGRWSMNGEAIKIAEDGTLLDGQHRLAAIVKANTDVTTLVVRGLPIETQGTMDIGRKRAVRDVLHIGNVPNASTVASIANTLVRWNKTSKISEFRFCSVSNVQVQSYIDAHPEIVNSAHFARSQSAGNPMQRSVVGVLHYLANVRFGLGEEFEQYIGVMKTGLPIYEGDAAYHFREKILRQLLSKSMFRPGDQLAMALNTFSHFVNRTPCTKIYIKDLIEFPGFDPSTI